VVAQTCLKLTTDFANLKVVTTTAENAFPSILKSRRSAVKTQVKNNDLDEGATVSCLQRISQLEKPYT
jgi:hypothetical protein